MSKKRLDPIAISNELRGASLHFIQRELSPTSKQLPEETLQGSELTAHQSQDVGEGSTNEPTLVSLETSFRRNIETSFQGNNETTKHVSKETKKQRNKSLKRYATYLPEQHIREMQKIAFESNRKDYEVFQEAVEKYIKRNTN
jgi:hypothetical protein